MSQTPNYGPTLSAGARSSLPVLLLLALGFLAPLVTVAAYAFATPKSFEVFSSFEVFPPWYLDRLIVLTILGVGVACLFRSERSLTIGVLLISGLFVGVVPSVIGYENNRYFVAPMLMWSAAVLLSLDQWLKRRGLVVSTLLLLFVLAIWAPLIPASHLRSTPNPPWGQELNRISGTCERSPQATVTVTFTPRWYRGHDEPTTPFLTCDQVREWLGEPDTPN